MAVESVVELRAYLGRIAVLFPDAEVFYDADVLRCRKLVPAPVVEGARRVAKERVIVVVPTRAPLDDGLIKVGITRGRGGARIEVFLEVVLDVVGIRSIGEDGPLIVPVVLIQPVGGANSANRRAGAVGAIIGEAPATHEVVQCRRLVQPLVM